MVWPMPAQGFGMKVFIGLMMLLRNPDAYSPLLYAFSEFAHALVRHEPRRISLASRPTAI